MTIEDQLRSAIEDSGCTYRSMAEDLDIDVSVLTRFVRKERGISLATASKIARYFGMELTDPKPII